MTALKFDLHIHYLPTTRELKNLYAKKGHDSLVWYAWRNALRILPLLGSQSFDQIWKSHITKSCYSLVRAHLLLAQWQKAKLKHLENNNIITSKAIYYELLEIIDTYTNSNNKNINNTITITAETIAILTKSLNLVDKVYMASALLATTIKETLDSKAAEQFRFAAKADFLYLLDIDKIDWINKPLWNQATTLNFKPNALNNWEKALIYNLKEHNLEFLAKDLENIWSSKSLDSHIENYLFKLSDSITTNPLALLYAVSYGEVSEPVKAVRVFLLGSGGAGKTSLAKCLKGEKPVISQPSTLGIDYQKSQPINLHKALPHLNLDPTPLDMYIWDFGGQAIFHGLHRTFLHENCVYVLVVDNRHEQAPEEWLHQISYLAESDAKVIVVTNQYENCNIRQNENRLLRKFKKILTSKSFFYFSCLQPNENCFKSFVNHLIQECLDSRKTIFKSTIESKELLFNHYQSEFFIYEKNLTKLINKEPNRVKVILDQLKQLGFLFPVKSGSSNYFLKPEWVLEYTYKILYSASMRKNKGLVSIKEIDDIFQNEIEPNNLEYLVDLLKDRSLCCLLPDGKYFFPDAAPENEPRDILELTKNNEQLALYIHTIYLPLGLHTRLVKALFESYLMRDKDIWRTGFVMHSSVVKKMVTTKEKTSRKFYNASNFDEDYQEPDEHVNEQPYSNKAIVSYNFRKNSISFTLLGDVKEYENLLESFLSELGKIISLDKVNISVKVNDNLFSTHSATYLIKILEGISTYSQLIEKIRAMTPKETNIQIDYTVNNGGKNSNFATKSENFSQNSYTQNFEIITDQHQQLTLLMAELLKNGAEGEELITIGTVQKALKTPDEPKSKNLLSKVLTGIKDFSVFAKDTGLPLAEKVAEHKDAIIGAMTTVAATASNYL